MTKTILFEIGTEELPASQIRNISKSLFESLKKKFLENEFLFENNEIFSTPRRIGFIFHNINIETAEKEIIKKGPKVSHAFDENNIPTIVGNGFAKSVNRNIDELITIGSGADIRLAYKQKIRPQLLSELAPSFLESSISQIQNAKSMYWGKGTVKFIRPIKWISIIINDEALKGYVFDYKISKLSRGHRVLGQNKFTLPNADSYNEVLEQNGVIANRSRRKKIIEGQIKTIAINEKCVPKISENLLEEVVDLVEWPEAMLGNFDKKFLKLPKEIVIATMQDHQRYFPVEKQDGTLENKFIFIANNNKKASKLIIEGNEKVLRPRLEDAKFFYEKDLSISVKSRLDELRSITYYKGLGSIYQKAERVKNSAIVFCNEFGASEQIVSEVAMLGYNDLTSNTVNEFPSLQGLMSAKFSELDKYSSQTVEALSTFYHPRFQEDSLPSLPEGLCVNFTEKLDTITGMFAIGNKPSGDKDPFGLRRASLGVVRILVEGKIEINLLEAINRVLSNFQIKDKQEKIEILILNFILDRFRSYLLDKQFSTQVTKCLRTSASHNIYNQYKKAVALQEFLKTDESSYVINGQKRIKNILKKDKYKDRANYKPTLASQKAEKHLFQKFVTIRDNGMVHFKNKNYSDYLNSLNLMKQEIDQFFQEVMVFDDNEQIARNRIRLLNSINEHLCLIGDLSELNG